MRKVIIVAILFIAAAMLLCVAVPAKAEESKEHPSWTCLNYFEAWHAGTPFKKCKTWASNNRSVNWSCVGFYDFMLKGIRDRGCSDWAWTKPETETNLRSRYQMRDGR